MNQPCAECRYHLHNDRTYHNANTGLVKTCAHYDAMGIPCLQARAEGGVCGPEARLFEEQNLH